MRNPVSAQTYKPFFRAFRKCLAFLQTLTILVRPRVIPTLGDVEHAHPLVDELFVLGGQLIKCNPVDAHRRCCSLWEAKKANVRQVRWSCALDTRILLLTRRACWGTDSTKINDERHREGHATLTYGTSVV